MKEIVFIEYPPDMVTINSYEDALEVLEDLKEIAQDEFPYYPVLKFSVEIN